MPRRRGILAIRVYIVTRVCKRGPGAKESPSPNGEQGQPAEECRG